MPRIGSTQTPLTKARKDKFLEVLADTGSLSAAARAASPHSKNGCKNTFTLARSKDPEFAKAWDDAITASLGKVEAEVMRRAMTPTQRPIFSKGELVGHEDVYDNKLLLALARKMSPDWRESKNLNVEGSIDHRHAHAHLSLSLDDVHRLAPEKADLLLELLSELADLRPNANDPILIGVDGDGDDDDE